MLIFPVGGHSGDDNKHEGDDDESLMTTTGDNNIKDDDRNFHGDHDHYGNDNDGLYCHHAFFTHSCSLP